MKTTLYTLLLISAISIASTGCFTTNQATGQREPDRARTEQVKAIATGAVTFGITEAFSQFPKDADKIELYARAAGGVFCEMQATHQFDPATLESGLYNLSLPHIEDEEVRRYLTTARNLIITTYQSVYAKRYRAELNPDEWPAVTAGIFCDAIDRGLKDSGRRGVKGVDVTGVLPATAPVPPPVQ